MPSNGHVLGWSYLRPTTAQKAWNNIWKAESARKAPACNPFNEKLSSTKKSFKASSFSAKSHVALRRKKTVTAWALISVASSRYKKSSIKISQKFHVHFIFHHMNQSAKVFNFVSTWLTGQFRGIAWINEITNEGNRGKKTSTASTSWIAKKWFNAQRPCHGWLAGVPATVARARWFEQNKNKAN